MINIIPSCIAKFAPYEPSAKRGLGFKGSPKDVALEGRNFILKHASNQSYVNRANGTRSAPLHTGPWIQMRARKYNAFVFPIEDE
jgi:hypothetical protein